MKRGRMELIKLALEGDKDAFAGLVRLHWTRLLRLARSVAGTIEAEDIVQDSFIIAWDKLGSLKQKDRFTQWISKIVYRQSLKYARQRSRFVPLFPSSRTEKTIQTGSDLTMDFEKALLSLTPKQRAVMYMNIIENKNDDEIAGILGIRKSTVRAFRKKARDRLARFYKEYSYENTSIAI